MQINYMINRYAYVRLTHWWPNAFLNLCVHWFVYEKHCTSLLKTTANRLMSITVISTPVKVHIFQRQNTFCFIIHYLGANFPKKGYREITWQRLVLNSETSLVKGVHSQRNLGFTEIVLKKKVCYKMLWGCSMHINELIFVWKEKK